MTRKRAIASQNIPPPFEGDGAGPDIELNLARALPAFAGADGVAALAPQDHVLPPRRLLWRENDTVAAVPVVCHGWAATSLTMSDGRRQILSFLLPGDIVSSVLVFDPVSRCSVETISELRYRTFARDTIKALMLQHPALLELMNRVREDETARSAYLAVGLGQRTAAERIAALLLSLADRLARRGMMRGATMDFPLRQHHVADATGLTVVHAGNMLNEFRRAGLIDISDRALTFLDAPGLRRVSGQF